MRTNKYRYSIIEKRKLNSYKRSIYIYLLLTVIIIIFLLYRGIPLIVKALNISEIFKRTKTTITINDNISPIVPRFNNIPTFVNQPSLDIEGTGEPGSNIVIILNNKENQFLSDSEGIFKTSLDLLNGENTLSAYSTDSSNNKSAETPIYKIIFDRDAPLIEIIRPKDNESIFGINNRGVTIEGKTESQSKLLINDRLAYVDSEGIFSYKYFLSDGDNTIIIKSTDRAGNFSQKTISLFYSD